MNSSIFYRLQGELPDRFWYQLNGKTPQENYDEQKANMLSRLNAENDNVELVIRTEVKK